jgi:hypothetical protein
MTVVKGYILVLSNKREPEEGSFLGLEGGAPSGDSSTIWAKALLE